MIIRLIGDVHGKIEPYKRIIATCNRSIQLGDMGFAEDYEQLSDVNPFYHRFVPGNHDDYDHLPLHATGDYGMTNEMFYIRGAFSVDQKWRKLGISYWANEELSYTEGHDCILKYEKAKPRIVISHDCPKDVLMLFITNEWKNRPSRTNELLSQLFDIHQPELWVFGHHHRSKTAGFKGTEFRCLDELEFTDVEVADVNTSRH